MKKIIALLLALVMCAALFAGCGGSDNNSGNNGGNNSGDHAAPQENDKTENSIIGTWEGDEAGEIITYTFKANGTFSASYVSGTYTISGDKITLSADVNGQEMKLFDNVTFSINGNTLKMGENTYTKK